MSACYCTGPQKGEPLCPCMMRAGGIYQLNGRWIQPEKDLGELPAPEPKESPIMKVELREYFYKLFEGRLVSRNVIDEIIAEIYRRVRE